MKFLKAAAAASIAGLMCIGMMIPAYAQTTDEQTDSTALIAADADASEDGGYLKYKNNMMRKMLLDKTPVGRMRNDLDMCKSEYGSYLTHDVRFNGMGRHYGIDISQWQTTDIDWDAVKEDGVEYVILRVGYRCYGSTGELRVDPCFHENITNAIAHGLKVGAYFYTQAVNAEEARAEADLCAGELKPYNIDLPVYYDIESVDYDTGRLDSADLSFDEKTALCEAFCDRIQSYGYSSGVYANKNWLTYMINGYSLGQKYHIWIAAYMSDITSYTNTYDTWQYTSLAEIPGIKGTVDTNVRYDMDFAPKDTPSADVDNDHDKMFWNKVDGADGYIVYGCDNDKDLYEVADVKGTEFKLPTPPPVKVCLTPYKDIGGDRYFGKRTPLINSFKGIISELTAELTALGKNTVTWAKVPGAVKYEVYSDLSGSYKLVSTQTDTTYKVSGKDDLKGCHIKVKAYSKEGYEGVMSDALDLVQNAPYDVPELSVYGSRICWGKIDGAQGYTIFGDNGFAADTTDIYYDVDGSEKGTYHVAAYVTDGNKKYYGDSSAKVTVKGVRYPPEGEIILDADDAGLVWNRLSDAAGYIIFKLDANGEAQEIARTRECRYDAPDLKGAVYFVRAFNAKNGEEFYSEDSNHLRISLPVVTKAKLESLTDAAAVVSWDEVNGCEEYMVYLDKGEGYELYTTVKGNMAMIGGIADAPYASIRIKAYSGSEELLSCGFYSNELFLIGDENSRPADTETEI